MLKPAPLLDQSSLPARTSCLEVQAARMGSSDFVGAKPRGLNRGQGLGCSLAATPQPLPGPAPATHLHPEPPPTLHPEPPLHQLSLAGMWATFCWHPWADTSPTVGPSALAPSRQGSHSGASNIVLILSLRPNLECPFRVDRVCVCVCLQAQRTHAGALPAEPPPAACRIAGLVAWQ